ncbi:OmpH family outer membrane protein [Sungkyunkwania multivorans]|uniref:OmpH family outer membrane protein n=1 Tax=Sungkyunkwania multivorans TaxID=1173618 RepID=A0ABW3D195_9FLAO
MKQLKTLFALLFLLTAPSIVSAQQFKVGHINVQQLLSEMPEMKAAQAELKKLETTFTADLQSSFQEFQQKAKLYESEASGKTQEENEKRAIELQNIERNLGEARQTASQELQKKQAELYQPILKKANDVVIKVARAQGLLYVLDVSPGGGVILADGKDLYNDVKRELGF